MPALPNHVNAEICADTIASKQQIIEYLAGTYLYRRLFANPAYYGIEDFSNQGLTRFLTRIVDECVLELTESSCITINEVYFLKFDVILKVYIDYTVIYYLSYFHNKVEKIFSNVVAFFKKNKRIYFFLLKRKFTGTLC